MHSTIHSIAHQHKKLFCVIPANENHAEWSHVNRLMRETDQIIQTYEERRTIEHLIERGRI